MGKIIQNSVLSAVLLTALGAAAVSSMDMTAIAPLSAAAQPATDSKLTEMRYISIKPISDNVDADQPVVLDVSIKNSSSSTLKYAESNPDSLFKLRVRSSAGTEIGLTRYGKTILGQANTTTRNVLVTLKPNEVKHYRILLSRLFDLTISGSYTITASCEETLIQPRNVRLVSNAAKVRVGDFDGRK